eukprot:6213321-Pleurochrysis_carterae.AAC.4
MPLWKADRHAALLSHLGSLFLIIVVLVVAEARRALRSTLLLVIAHDSMVAQAGVWPPAQSAKQQLQPATTRAQANILHTVSCTPVQRRKRVLGV